MGQGPPPDIKASTAWQELLHKRLREKGILPAEGIGPKQIETGASARMPTPAPAPTPARLSMAVAATFTAESLALTLNFWAGVLALPIEVQFAPYNQVFQELLDPRGLLSQNQGINVLVVRLEDWAKSESLERHAQELIRALGERQGAFPYILLFAPHRRSATNDEAARFDECEAEVAEAARSFAGVHVIRSAELHRAYPVENPDNPTSHAVGHIPYTDEMFAAMGTIIMRKVSALQRQPFKVVVVDADNTLWQGVCGEDGPERLAMTEGHLALQRFVVEQSRSGMLVCVCSKNEQDDVFRVFDSRRNDMELTRDHVTSWRVNWSTKSSNIESLAQELGLAVDSFIMLDDSPVECAEIASACPDVAVLQLPAAPASFGHFLDHVWAFDRTTVSEEDKNRVLFYRAHAAREGFRRQTSGLQQFLGGLELEVTIGSVTGADLARSAQLTERTTQFNTTGQKYTEAGLDALMKGGDAEIRVVRVRDRFGDYGLVGLAIGQVRGETLVVDTFLLSCRVLGRRVEHRMVRDLWERGQARGVTSLALEFVRSARNKPAYDFVVRFGADALGDGARRHVGKEDIERLDVFDSADGSLDTDMGEGSLKENILSPRAPAHRAFDFARIATELNDGREIHRRAVESQTVHRPSLASAFKAPRTELEHSIARLWEEMLGVDRVGIYDDFFELGGHSLLAARIVARLQDTLQIELTLGTILDTKTIAGMSEAICLTQQGGDAPKKSIQKIPRRADPTLPVPLSFAQQLFWLHHYQATRKNVGSLNPPHVLRLPQDLDVQMALDTLLDVRVRHEILRTVIPLVKGRPLQVVLPAESVKTEVTDLRHHSAAEGETKLASIVASEQATPIDLVTTPAFRARLVLLSGAPHALVWSLEHVASDFISAVILVRDLKELFRARAEHVRADLPILPIQYADYALWERERAALGAFDHHLSYWKKAMEGATPLTFPRVDKDSSPLVTRRFTPQQREGILLSSKNWGVTPFTLRLSALFIALFETLNVQDIRLGVVSGNRSRAEVGDLVGPFAQALPVRARRDPAVSRRDFVRSVHVVVINATIHECPMATIMAALGTPHFPFDFVVTNIAEAIEERTGANRDGSQSQAGFNRLFKFDSQGISFEHAGAISTAVAKEVLEAFSRALDDLAHDGSSNVGDDAH